MQVFTLIIYFREGKYLRPTASTIPTNEKTIQEALPIHYNTLKEQIINHYSKAKLPTIAKEEIFFAPSEESSNALIGYLEGMNSPENIRNALQYKMMRCCDHAIPFNSSTNKVGYKIYQSKDLIGSAPKHAAKLRIAGLTSVI